MHVATTSSGRSRTEPVQCQLAAKGNMQPVCCGWRYYSRDCSQCSTCWWLLRCANSLHESLFQGTVPGAATATLLNGRQPPHNSRYLCPTAQEGPVLVPTPALPSALTVLHTLSHRNPRDIPAPLPTAANPDARALPLLRIPLRSMGRGLQPHPADRLLACCAAATAAHPACLHLLQRCMRQHSMGSVGLGCGPAAVCAGALRLLLLCRRSRHTFSRLASPMPALHQQATDQRTTVKEA
jgi:hypothetical protein